MATKAIVYKAELEISDIDRSYYATHTLILARHPSENDRRLMARIIVFALFAHERLEFGRGLSNEEDPDLWQRDHARNIESWIELGQPEESAIRRACGRAQQVVVVSYSGNSAEVWWSKNEAALGRLKNLQVIDLNFGEV
ncbi:MAG TPA: YaeQ family protein, partial [Pirellula sp.]|nr:YaeQ family protein [Pirellula sp.]